MELDDKVVPDINLSVTKEPAYEGGSDYYVFRISGPSDHNGKFTIDGIEENVMPENSLINGQGIQFISPGSSLPLATGGSLQFYKGAIVSFLVRGTDKYKSVTTNSVTLP